MRKAKITVIPAEDNDNGQSILRIEGELTLNTIEETLAEVKAIVDEHQNLLIELRQIDNLDLTGVQLLYAIKKTAEASKKTINYSIELPDELSTIINHAGFNDLINKA